MNRAERPPRPSHKLARGVGWRIGRLDFGARALHDLPHRLTATADDLPGLRRGGGPKRSSVQILKIRGMVGVTRGCL